MKNKDGHKEYKPLSESLRAFAGANGPVAVLGNTGDRLIILDDEKNEGVAESNGVDFEKPESEHEGPSHDNDVMK